MLVGNWGKNVVIFGMENDSSVHADDRIKDILVLNEGPRGRLDDTTVTSEANYCVNITKA